jgi:hypothetical protein
MVFCYNHFFISDFVLTYCGPTEKLIATIFSDAKRNIINCRDRKNKDGRYHPE